MDGNRLGLIQHRLSVDEWIKEGTDKFFGALGQIQAHRADAFAIFGRLHQATRFEGRIGIYHQATSQTARVAVFIRHPDLQAGFFGCCDVLGLIVPCLVRTEISVTIHEQLDTSDARFSHLRHGEQLSTVTTKLDQTELGRRMGEIGVDLAP